MTMTSTYFDDEMRFAAYRVVAGRATSEQVAEDMGIDESLVHRWLRQYFPICHGRRVVRSVAR